jgi:hypothetical protein
MDNPVLITDPGQLENWDCANLAWPYQPEDLIRHGPDAHWVCLDAIGQPAARCSLWCRPAASLGGHQLGFIGHYAAAGVEAAVKLLAHACQQLQRAGSTFAVGPLDGNTWRRYRFVTGPGERPAFFLEPANPASWPKQWASAGFREIAQYQSRVVQDLAHEDERGLEAGHRLTAVGVRTRPLEIERLEEELKRLYPMIVRCFQRGFLYSPISQEAFVAQHLPLRNILRPELVRIAEHREQPVGLLFGIPDIQQAHRGEAINTSIIKTLVIDPGRIYAGLGSYLAAEYHKLCRGLSYSHVIHALMHSASKSQNISARYGPIMRQYGLFGKEL